MKQYKEFSVEQIMSELKALGIAEQQPGQPASEKTQSLLEQLHNEIEHYQTRHSLLNNQLHIVNRIVENAHFAVLITDAEQKIIYVNQAYTDLTGLQSHEVFGKTPKVNQSGRQTDAFYQKMWQQLSNKDYWRGEVWDRHVDGSFFMKYLSVEAIRNSQDEVTNYFAIFNDLSELNRTKEELDRVTHYDPLTQLANRVLFYNRLNHEFNISNRHNARTGLLVLNINRFRLINDAFGFVKGDELLIEVAKRLKTSVRSTDLLARQEERTSRDADLVSRISGDHFSFILSELRYPEDANVVARRLLKVFEKPFEVEGEELFLSCSIGIAVYPENAPNGDELMACAESAMEQVKSEGKGDYRFFSEEMNRKSAQRVRLETQLHRAVAENEFTLFYQPKFDVQKHEYVGMEALLRWPRKEGPMMPPDQFIPLTEDIGLIAPIGRWIIHQAIADTQKLNQITGKDYQVAINLSARQFLSPGVVGVVQDALDSTGMNPRLVELEITESMLIEKIDDARQAMKNLRKLGVKLAIDDFGTGYSSLSYLRQFPVTTMKIDRSFVSHLNENTNEFEFIRAIVGLGKSMGLEVVAEGVEQSNQLSLLKQVGCDFIQGYYIDKPMPLDALIERFSASSVVFSGDYSELNNSKV